MLEIGIVDQPHDLGCHASKCHAEPGASAAAAEQVRTAFIWPASRFREASVSRSISASTYVPVLRSHVQDVCMGQVKPVEFPRAHQSTARSWLCVIRAGRLAGLKPVIFRAVLLAVIDPDDADDRQFDGELARP